MPALVFRMRNVPEDEADAVRELLDQNRFEWYETTAGNWGIAMPGLWISNEEDLPLARQLIEEHQSQWREKQLSERQARIEAGLEPGLVDRLKERPFASAGTIAFCLFVIYAMLSPFVRMASGTS